MIEFSSLLDYLREDRIREKQEVMLAEKIKRFSNTSIGRNMGVEEGSKIDAIPLSRYESYKDYFENPIQDAFMYPLDKYVKVMTSGTSGIPKWYLLPIPWLEKDVSRAFLALIAGSTHDGSRIRLEEGDIFYGLGPPKPFMSGVMWEFLQRYTSSIKLIPSDPGIPFPDKIALFIKHYEEIDVAGLPLVLLWNMTMVQQKQGVSLCPRLSILQVSSLTGGCYTVNSSPRIRLLRVKIWRI